MNTNFRNLSALCLVMLSLFAGASAHAAVPLLLCGAQDQAGNTEVDNLTVYRGGNYQNQLVIRNVNIIQDFISKGAIHPNEVNAKGEFIFEGLGSPNPPSVSVSFGDRYFTFIQTNDGYQLNVLGVAQNGINFTGTIASFTFKDCEKQ